jgi:hypothetical protein
MAKISGANMAWVEEKKIIEYLLNESHADGRSKAQFFGKHGFSSADWKTLRVALVTHAQTNEVVKNADGEFGKRITVDCSFPTPDGVNPCIRTIWEIRDQGSAPRLITAHPRPKPKG